MLNFLKKAFRNSYLAALFLITFSANAQQYTPNGGYFQWTGGRFTYGLRLPVRDTVSDAGKIDSVGTVIYRGGDSAAYVKRPDKWQRIGTAADLSNYYTKTQLQTSGQSQVHWGNITNTPTTLGGYGITDAVPSARLINTTLPLAGGGNLSADRTLSIADAVADGATKGAASFTTNDFNSTTGNISIDYTNGQAGSGSTKGFITATDWNTFNSKGSGSVTSVGLSLPSIFSITGSPVTTTGTLTGTLVSQTANTVFAAPNGSAGAPTFRTLATADIPALDAAKITTGIFPIARGGTGLGALGTANQLIRVNAGGTALEYFSSISVPNTRLINTTAPLAGGGNLTADRTLSITQATTSTNGYLTSTDWNTFNNKLTSVNGLTGPALTLATGTAGTNFTITPSGSNITFDLPDASATARGVVTTGAQTWAGIKTFNAQLNAAGGLNVTGTATVSNIAALGTPASVFLTHTAGLLQSRTAAQVLSDIAATPTARTITVAGTAPIVSSAGAQDLTANRTWTLSHAASGVTPATYNWGTVNTTGHVTAANSVTLQQATTAGNTTGNGIQITGIAMTPATGAGLELQGSATTGYVFAYNRTGAVPLPLRISHAGGDTYINEGSGDVGIGTTTPTSKLHVAGTARITGVADLGNTSLIRGSSTGGANVSYMQFTESNGTTRTGYIGDGSGSESDMNLVSDLGNIALFTGGLNRLHVTAAGNVGIGLTNPSTPLQVNGTITAPTLISPASSALVLQAATGENIDLATSAAIRMTIKADGAIDMGVPSSPFGGILLNVGGNIQSNDAYVLSDGTTNAEFGLGGSLAFIRTVSNHPLQIKTNDTERMRFEAGGNIGINTINSNSNFFVNGSVGAKVNSVNANTTIAADDFMTEVSNAGAVTMTLPAVGGCAGRIYVIKKLSAGGNNVVIDGNSADQIDGVTTKTLTLQYSSVILQSDGIEWRVIGAYATGITL